MKRPSAPVVAVPMFVNPPVATVARCWTLSTAPVIGRPSGATRRPLIFARLPKPTVIERARWAIVAVRRAPPVAPSPFATDTSVLGSRAGDSPAGTPGVTIASGGVEASALAGGGEQPSSVAAAVTG